MEEVHGVDQGLNIFSELYWLSLAEIVDKLDEHANLALLSLNHSNIS